MKIRALFTTTDNKLSGVFFITKMFIYSAQCRLILQNYYVNVIIAINDTVRQGIWFIDIKYQTQADVFPLYVPAEWDKQIPIEFIQ